VIRNAPRSNDNLSTAAADYLKAIYELEEAGQRVTTSALAKKLAVAPASVTGMLQRLAENRPRLVDYERYHGVALTPAGRKMALETVRRQRLLELYLAETLGYPWDQVGAEAEQLEHAISNEFEEKIAALLGNPTTDPHGDPIPNKDGALAAQSLLALADALPGQTVRVTRVRDEEPALLRYLAELGLAPQVSVVILVKAPFDGPVTVSVGGHTHALGRQVAEQIFVTVEEA
jgi:DtxR family Mn-dependent transcriptional regulator